MLVFGGLQKIPSAIEDLVAMRQTFNFMSFEPCPMITAVVQCLGCCCGTCPMINDHLPSLKMDGQKTIRLPFGGQFFLAYFQGQTCG